MRCVAENTAIPVPKILAYSADANSDPLSTFIILDYIDGKMLSSVEMGNLTAQERQELYASLADIYIQLRRLEFPCIGRIEETSHGFEVCQKTISIDMNMQQLEGLNPCVIQDSYHDRDGRLGSANAYTRMLLDFGYNAFFKSRNAVQAGMGRDAVYHHWLFHRHAKSWVDPAFDGGPFVLVHGDFHPFNLIIDEQMRISAVLDWEWSRATPVQFFMPPLWLSGRSTVQLAGQNTWQLFLEKSFRQFLSKLENQEKAMFGNTLLANEWAERSSKAEPLVANALENWTDVDWFAFRYLSSGGGAATKKAIDDFIDEDPMRRLVAEMKEQDESAYRKEAAAKICSPTCQHEQSLLSNFLGKISGIPHTSSKARILGVAALIGFSLLWRRPRLNPNPQVF